MGEWGKAVWSVWVRLGYVAAEAWVSHVDMVMVAWALRGALCVYLEEALQKY